MESMYTTLETGGVGLFESPTGDAMHVYIQHYCLVVSALLRQVLQVPAKV